MAAVVTASYHGKYCYESGGGGRLKRRRDDGGIISDAETILTVVEVSM